MATFLSSDCSHRDQSKFNSHCVKKGRRPKKISVTTASECFSQPNCFLTNQGFKLQRELNLLPCYLCENGQSVLNLQYFYLTVFKFGAVRNERTPGRMKRGSIDRPLRVWK